MLTTAHTYSEGEGVTIGVVDTGVDSTHPDLAGNVLIGIDFTDPAKPNGVGDGHTDIDSHGTANAAIIAGHGHGQSAKDGIIGIAPKAKILPARNLVSAYGLNVTQMANSIRWVVDHGATVVCIAEAGNNGNSSEQAAVKYAEANDVVVVAGVGNLPLATGVGFPAAYPGVLAAGGTDEHGLHAAVSVTGPQVVLSAPATNIYSAGLNHGYSTGTGTSNSTAIIAGAAALVRSRFPKLSAVEVIHRLTATATDMGPPGRDDEYGYGDLNLVAALTANVPPLGSAPSKSPTTTPSTHTPTSTVPTITGTGPSVVAADKPTSSTALWLTLLGALAAVIIVLTAWITIKRRRPT